MNIWEFCYPGPYYSFYTGPDLFLNDEPDGTSLEFYCQDLGWIEYGPHGSIVGTFRVHRLEKRR